MPTDLDFDPTASQVPAQSPMGQRLPWGYRFHTRGAFQGLDFLANITRYVAGLAMVAAAAGLWAYPGSSWAADVVAIKFALTAGLLCGAGFLASAQRTNAIAEAEIDLERGKVRFLSRDGGQKTLVRQYRFDEISDLFVEGGALHLIGKSGRPLAVIDLATVPASVAQ